MTYHDTRGFQGVNAQDKWGATALHWAADQDALHCAAFVAALLGHWHSRILQQP